MSNPILLTAALSNDTAYQDRSGAGTMTVAGPERYLDEEGLAGYWAEEGSTHLFSNPVAGNGTAGLNTALLGRAFDVVPVPVALPGWLGPLVTQCFRATATGDQGSASSVFLSQEITFTANPFAAQVMVYVPTAFSAPSIQLTVTNLAGATIQPTAVDMGIRDQWQPVANTRFTPAADLTGSLQLLQSGGWLTGEEIYFVCIQYEQKAYSTSPAVGSLGPGYSWAGTPHASASVRTASRVTMPSGILAPSSGALAFRVTPTIETGVEEIWGECGVKGAGTDHLRWGRDASTHPFVEWSANNAAYQRLTGSEALSAGTAYDVYLGHTGTVTSLAVDAGTLQTGTRAAVSGDFSTGDLTLEASAGGVIYQPFATFNRTLTAKEIATLNGKNNWTMKVLAGNPYINFQLRPY